MDERKLLKRVFERDTANSGRLQSLKLPRDLSLGLTAKPKKQYAPNINVVRNKDKSKEFMKKQENKEKPKVLRERPQRQNNKDRFIRTEGIFSQGVAEGAPRVRSGVEAPRVSFREPRNAASRSSKAVGNTAGAKEGDDTRETSYFDSDSQSGSDEEALIFLPLHGSKPPAAAPKSEVKVECGPELPRPFNWDQLYSDENPSVCFLKLTDSLPERRVSEGSKNKLCDYPLDAMPEGQIGKLRMWKSGRVEAVLGNVSYDLLPEDSSFEGKSELVCIDKSGDGQLAMMVLADMMNSFTLAPDYDGIA